MSIGINFILFVGLCRSGNRCHPCVKHKITVGNLKNARNTRPTYQIHEIAVDAFPYPTSRSLRVVPEKQVLEPVIPVILANPPGFPWKIPGINTTPGVLGI